MLRTYNSERTDYAQVVRSLMRTLGPDHHGPELN
jgi:hypothetical protein